MDYVIASLKFEWINGLLGKEKKDKKYNVVIQVVTLTLFVIIISTLAQELGKVSKEVSPLIICIGSFIPVFLLFYQRFKINVLNTGGFIR